MFRQCHTSSRETGPFRWPSALAHGFVVWSLYFLAIAACAGDWGLQLLDAPEGGAAMVTAVVPGSPAEQAGLQAGDRILRAQNFLVRNAAEYQLILRTEKIDVLHLGVTRDGWAKEIQVLPPGPTGGGKPWLGVQVSDPPPDSSGAPPRGALVTAVTSDGPAAQAGIRERDLITSAEGRPLDDAASLATFLESWPAGQPLRLGLARDGWSRETKVTPGSQTATTLPKAPYGSSLASPAAAPQAWSSPSSPPPVQAMPPGVAAPVTGNKALVAIGDFRVKAATANQAIGDGLREMLLTALYRSGNYAVVERMDIQGLAAEQALSRSRMAREGSAIPEQQMDVAEIMIYGSVTEFEGAARGSSFQASIPRAPLSFGHDASTAHMAIDVRIVDVASGRVLGAQRIAGDAKSSQTTLGGTPTVRGVGIPASLGVFSNTPMEQAIRVCVDKAVAYVSATVPPGYFRHR